MNEPHSGGPAFPQPKTPVYDKDGRPSYYDPITGCVKEQPGMSLRAYIATAALSNMPLRTDGSYSKTEREVALPELHAKWTAAAAVRYADTLIEELNKPKA